MARRTNTKKFQSPTPVIIGAGITEQWYFTYLQNLLNLRIRIRPRFFGTEDIHELDKRITQVIREGAIAVCVFDTDTTKYSETEAKKVESLKRKYADKKNVVLCDSLPSMEYWFLIHYEDTNRLFANSHAAEIALRSHIVSYEKKEIFLKNAKWVADMISGGKMDNAIARAKAYESVEGSYSRVYKAVELLKGKL
jgi:hypothetical protein